MSISIFFWLFSYISDTCKHTALLAATCTFWWPLFELSAFHSKRGQLHFQMLFQLPSRSQLSNIRCSGMCRREMRQAVLPKIRGQLQKAHIKLSFFSGNTASTKLTFFIITDLADLTGVVRLAWAGVSTVLTRSKRFSQNTACLFLDLLP